jgi:PHP family Zn ribbon phosphoesterase
MPAKNSKEYTTITVPRKDYEKLLKFKKQLEDRDDFSWVTALGLGAFVGFMISLASDATNRPFLICNCGSRIDLTQWNGEEVKCTNCGRSYPQAQPR